MPALIDLVGKTFGRLIVIERVANRGTGAAWKCFCNCGIETIVRSHNLLTRHTLSCGCLSKEVHRNRLIIHGHAPFGKPSRTYRIWRHIKSRCLNPRVLCYKYYGGRGISICDRWKNSFSNFLEDMGESPTGLSIDRIDCNGNYEPGNCRWVTMAQQRSNRRDSFKVAA